MQETVSILTTPEEISAVKEEEIAFLKVIEKAQEKGMDNKETEETLKKHYEEYKWIRHSWDGPNAPYQYFENKLKEALKKNINPTTERKKYDEERQNSIRKIEEIENKYIFTEEEKQIILIGRSIVFLKAYRKEHLFEALSALEPLLEEIAGRIKVTVPEIRFLMRDEVTDALLNNKEYKALAEKRKEHCVFLLEDREMKVLIDGEMESFLNNIHKEKIDETQKELKGMCAQKGYAKVVVKHVATVADMKKFNRGDILVSAATNPMIVPAMERAGAIITDEGGITCHAAVLSREFNIPTLMGTEVATKVFNTGDYVHVDTALGIANKVKSAMDSQNS